MTQAQSLLWLKISCLITIVTGIACAMASHPATDIVWRTLFDLLKWPFDGDPAAFTADTRAVNAVLGGTMVGWGVLMYLLATPAHIAALPMLPRVVKYALYAWFVVDCVGSLAAGLPGNVVLNVLFLALFVPPLRALERS